MSTFVYFQLYTFLAAFYGGVVIAFMYDVYKIYRRLLKTRKIVATIQDLLFWVVIAMVATSVLVFSNDGKVRGYSLLGFILGALIYHLLLSKVVVKAINEVLKVIKRIALYIYGKIKRAFKTLFKFIMYPYKRIYKTMSPLIKRVKRISNIPSRIVKEIRKYSKLVLGKK